LGAIAEIVEEQKSVPSKKEIADLKDFILGDGFLHLVYTWAYILFSVSKKILKHCKRI
jgi:hypothetical protein